MRVGVVGGGITGLVACYHLEKLGVDQITLFEPSSRVGGKVRTVYQDGFTIECGPDSIFVRNQEVLELITDLGLDEEVIEPRTRGFSLWIQGGLRPIPEGLSRLGSVSRQALEEFPFLSSESKFKVLQEVDVPPSELNQDESIRSFFSRRFGAEFTATIIEPLFAGTHGGQADLLSMGALFPSYVALEREFGSLSAAGQLGRTASLAKFISFKEGTEALVSRLFDRLERTCVERQPVLGFTPLDRGVEVAGAIFDAIIFAVPAKAAAFIFESQSLRVKGLLKSIRSSSSTVITFAFNQTPEFDRVFGTGFLVPETADLPITGATFSSKKWHGRSPEGFELLRVFLKGNLIDSEELALKCFERVSGISLEPLWSRVDRWDEGLPQYQVGHRDLVEDIQSEVRELGPISLAGQSYGGAGIPDCIRQGREAAELAVNSLRPGS